MEEKKSGLMQIVVAGLLLIVIAISYFKLLDQFHQEGQASNQQFSKLGADYEEHLQVDANVVSIDPIKGDMVIRLQFDPSEGLLDDNQLLKSPLSYSVSSTTGKSELKFRKRETMSPADVTVSLKGAVSEYPFDGYEAELYMDLYRPYKSEGELEFEPIALAVNFQAAVAGWQIESRAIDIKNERSDEVPYHCRVVMKIERSRSLKAFSVFVMVLMGLLTFVAMAVGMSVCVGGRKVELAMFSWLAALLFALVPLRNAMPGAPPIGCLSDYLSFFWAEALTTLTLIAIVFTWLKRKT